MEILRGKRASYMDSAQFGECADAHESVMIDIGTGDGRFVLHHAQKHPAHLVIGVDACRENLHEASRRAPANALFVIANALTLPRELHGCASHLTINFPWSSLLDGLLDAELSLVDGLAAVAPRGAQIEVWLNGGALTEAGWPLEAGTDRVREVLATAGFAMRSPMQMQTGDLRAFPTTWAKRLAFGRDPRAMIVCGERR